MRLPALLCAACLTCASLVPAPLEAAASSSQTDVAGPRIRFIDDRVRSVFRMGMKRSEIFRQLVDRIERGYVIVYVGTARSMDDHIAGHMVFVGDGGRYRYLRAMLNPTLSIDLAIASLAHEFHHVIEIMDHPEVRSEATLVALYEAIGEARGGRGPARWETDAAIATGQDVRRELASGTMASARQSADLERDQR